MRRILSPVRHPRYHMTTDQALAYLAGAPYVHLASTTADGAPVLRAVHGVVVDGWLAFHGAPDGEKLEILGRPCVVSAEEIVAEIPSYWLDPERACPATTYYLSAQAHGIVEEVADVAWKARALQALMARYQPEGGHAPITADDPRYRAAVKGLLVARVPLDRVTGKAKLGQNRKADDLGRVVAALWQRGRPGDLRAIELVRAANPGVPAPPSLAAPDGVDLVCHLDAATADEVAALLAGAYWTDGIPADRLAGAQLAASAWVGARDRDGRLIGSARALSDRTRRAYLYDVVVAPAWRGRGVGQALVRALLDHPAVRDTSWVWLATKDAASLYERFGFQEVAPDAVWRYPQLVRTRA